MVDQVVPCPIEVSGVQFALVPLNGWALMRLDRAGVTLRDGGPANVVYEVAACLRTTAGEYVGAPEECRREIEIVGAWSYEDIRRIGLVVEELSAPEKKSTSP